MLAAGETLEARWRKLAYAGELIWILHLVLVLLAGLVVEIFPLRNDYFRDLVDIPASLAQELRALDVRMADGRVPVMNSTYMPVNNYAYFSILIAVTSFFAAVRGRWPLFAVTLIAMLVPAPVFGAGGNMGGAALLAGMAGIGRCVFKRDFKLIWPIIAGSIVVWFAANIVILPKPHDSIVVERKVDSNEFQRLMRFESSFQSLPPEHQAAANYVRAQIAYIHHDWPALKSLSQSLEDVQIKQFEDTPYKAARLRVLKQAVQSLQTPPQPESWFALHSDGLRVFHESFFFLAIGLSILTGLLRWRIKRVAKIARQIDALPPLWSRT